MSESIPIPGPPPLPLIGNLRDIDLNNTIQSFTSLAKAYGPIFKLHLGGSERVFITSHELANEVLSRKDFVKKITGTTEHLSKLIPHGILTANHGQESWGLTRRTLNPAFTKASVKDMFPGQCHFSRGNPVTARQESAGIRQSVLTIDQRYLTSPHSLFLNGLVLVLANLSTYRKSLHD
jgi:hypothetical protein